MPASLPIEIIQQLVAEALESARREGVLQLETMPEIQVERPGNPDHGDFSTNLPLRLARATRINPLELAELLAAHIPAGDVIERVEAAPPGFVNFFLKDSWLQQQVETVRQAGNGFGNVASSQVRRIMVEFVSVNPTGPVHVGHARGAVLGSSLANILEAAGHEVYREYYVNDAGSQMKAFYGSVLDPRHAAAKWGSRGGCSAAWTHRRRNRHRSPCNRGLRDSAMGANGRAFRPSGARGKRRSE